MSSAWQNCIDFTQKAFGTCGKAYKDWFMLCHEWTNNLFQQKSNKVERKSPGSAVRTESPYQMLLNSRTPESLQGFKTDKG